jgi:hypothetical protein
MEPHSIPLWPVRLITVRFFFSLIVLVSPLSSQAILFDFDNAPLQTSLPIYQTAGGITAHLSATGQGYSIQNVTVMGFTPPGFAGRIIYPNSIFLADLLVHFDQVLTDFSIMYACQELGCDDAATMRVTAYMNGSYVGANTRTATFPGTWPVDTLRCSFPQGFDSVVVHYYLRPPTCQDYGTIFIADNMRVTPVPVSVISGGEIPETFMLKQNYPNPFNPVTFINYEIPMDAYITLKIYDPLGVEILRINEFNKAGSHEVKFDGSNLASGMYFYTLESNEFKETRKMVLIK